MVAFGDLLLDVLDLVDKGLNGIFLVKVERYLDKGFYAQPKLFFIHQGVVTFDILFVVFQFAHKRSRVGGRRKADFVDSFGGWLSVRSPAISSVSVNQFYQVLLP